MSITYEEEAPTAPSISYEERRATPKIDEKSRAARRVADEADMRRMADPTTGMSGLSKFNAGMGKAFTDIGQGAQQLVGMGPSAEEVRERRALDKPLMNTGAGTAGNVAGNIAMMAPLAVVPGGATVAGAGALGAVAGALQPTEGAGERIGNMALGGALGSGVQAATHIPRVLGNLREAGRAVVEPLSAGGRDQIIGRTLNQATGGQEKAVIQRLQDAAELVPGSAPTAGQAGGNAGLAALERTATATNPTVMELSRQRMGTQNAARTNMLDDLAGTSGERNFFADAREATAKKLYDEAYEKGVDLARDAASGKFLPKASVTGRKGEITKLMSAPSMQEASALARRLMADDPNLKSKLLDPSGSVQGLDYTRRALSDMIGDSKGNQQRILMGLRERLDTTLNTISPKYAEARTTFSRMSEPINQMDIVKALRDKATRPLDQQLMPGQFARSLSDDTAAAATGFSKATLDSSLTPRASKSLFAIKDDLARAEFAKNAGRGVGSDSVQKLAMTRLLEGTGVSRLPDVLTGTVGRPVRWGVEKIYGGADEAAAKRLAEALLAPQETARIMAGVKPTAGGAMDEQTRLKLATLLRASALPAIPQMVDQ